MKAPAPLKLARIATAAPCANCPFRRDVSPFLRPARVRQIVDAAVDQGQHFVCHKTVNYARKRSADLGRRACAGFLILAERSGFLAGIQFVQLAERLAGITFAELRGRSLVYASAEAMIAAHEAAEARPRPRRGDKLGAVRR